MIFILLIISYLNAECFPPNNLKIPTGLKSLQGLNEIQMQKIIDEFHRIMSPYVKERIGRDFSVDAQWSSDRVNASTTLDDQDNPIITIHGGMVRHELMNKEALQFILCHELGHHFGGAPKSFRGRSHKRSWSSAEGQADYFSASKCLPYFYSQIPEEKKSFSPLPEKTQDLMNSVCRDSLCQKVLFAGQTVMNMFASLRQSADPEIGAGREGRVFATNYGHPSPQCRLDTVVAGVLCHVDSSEDFDDVDYRIGACHREEQGENVLGARPFCWFSPEQY